MSLTVMPSKMPKPLFSLCYLGGQGSKQEFLDTEALFTLQFITVNIILPVPLDMCPVCLYSIMAPIGSVIINVLTLTGSNLFGPGSISDPASWSLTE